MKKILLDNRLKLVEKYCKGKSVLDIGCVGGIGSKKEKFTHQAICDIAKDVIGLDNNEKSVKRFNAAGYNLIYADAQRFDLKSKFDVVFAGEIIEHIEDQGVFLENIKNI